MLLINKRVRLRHGSLIRVLGTQCMPSMVKPPVYQYTVDMLWPNNKWHRILVSKLYDEVWPMMIAINAYAEQSSKSFNMMYYVKVNRKKYGKEKIVAA